MIQIKFEGSRINKPWVVIEGEYRQIWPNDKPRWETDRVLGEFQFKREAENFLLAFQAGLLSKPRRRK